MPVTSTQCIIGTKKCPEAGMLLSYDDDDDSQGYGQYEEAFRAPTKDDILQPCLWDQDFKDDFGYNLYAFDI